MTNDGSESVNIEYIRVVGLNVSKTVSLNPAMIKNAYF